MDPNYIEAIYPLSPMQQGILFHSAMSGGSDPYLGQLTITLTGPLDAATLEHSWRIVAGRHSILRTAFVTEKRGRPMQVVLKDAPFDWQEMDWLEFEREAQEQKWEQLLASDRAQNFDLATAPLFRLKLIRFEREIHKLLWTEHHLILDGWSVPLLLNELSAVYSSELQGLTAQIPAAKPYRDYIDWLASQNAGAAETYWRALLAGVEAPFILRAAKSASSQQAHIVQVSHRSVSALDGLRDTARSHRITLNIVLQAVWALLLSRVTGSRDVLYGSTTSGRPAELDGVETIVGPFINTVPVFIKIDPAERFGQFCRRLQEQQFDSQRFEYASLADIQKWAGMDAGQGLFESIFVFENYPARNRDKPQHEGLRISEVTASEQSSFPLALLVGAGERLRLKALYAADRFDNAYIEDLLQRFVSLLLIIVESPNPRIADLSILRQTERLELADWRGNLTNYPRDCSLSEIFAEQVRQHSDSVALRTATSIWTYGELDASSNRLARYLRSQGIRTEDVVGVLLERGPAMIVALLGILKAGAAYLPLDSGNPRTRVHHMLDECRAAWVVSERKLASVLQGAEKVILVDDDTIASFSDDKLPSHAGPRNAAYVMYTSGSTGKPKGATIEHRSVARLVRGAHYVAFTSKEVFLQFAPLAFDASTFEIWGSLLNGACLVLAPAELLSLEELAGVISGAGVTTLWLTSGLFRSMIETHGKLLQGVRQLLAGGEALPVPTVREALRLLPRTRLVNGYGPTENCTFTCCHTITDQDAHSDSIPIGRPISNTRVYILDGDLQPVPPGIAGELYTGGDGIARDYRRRPDLTADNFLPDPFCTEPGARMYRTGDRVRYRADGAIEFLGRIDGQVKIRGFRIETEEIEAILSSHPVVRQCVVVIHRSESSDARILGFVVRRAGEAFDENEIRKYMESQLPAYMIPAIIVECESLPLTPNGKIDRKELLKLCQAPSSGEGLDMPATPMEELLADVWRELLQTTHVGRRDDFFQSGGHSLLAMRAISRIRDLTTSAVPLRTIFEKTTLGELAAEIERLMRDGQWSGLVIEPAQRNGPPPLSLAQQRLWFLNRLETGNRFYNMHLAFRLRGELKLSALERALHHIGLRHESLRTTFPDRDGEPVQKVAEEPAYRLRCIDCEEDAVRCIVEREAHAPFHLELGPLFRPVLIRISATDHILLLAMHHIISDGHSIGILLDELSQLYAGGTLPQLTIQYVDYAVWESRCLTGSEMERLSAFWRQALAEAPPPLQFLEARPRPVRRSFSGATHSRLLPAGIQNGVAGFSRREGATRFMVFLAAYYVLIRRHAGQDDLTVGADSINRSHAETQGTIGFFVNQLPLRLHVSAGQTFRSLVKQVRQMTLSAYAHQELPFQKLMDGLKVERRLNHSSLFQTKLLYQQGETAQLSFTGIVSEPYPIGLDSSAFDLVLAILDTPGHLLATFEYDTDLLDAAPVSHMAEDFEHILSAAIADPASTVETLNAHLDEVNQHRREKERRTREAEGFRLLRGMKAVPVSH